MLMLGKSPIKWRQRPDMTIAVDWDVKHQFKQTHNQTWSITPIFFQLEAYPGAQCFSSPGAKQHVTRSSIVPEGQNHYYRLFANTCAHQRTGSETDVLIMVV